MEFGQEELDKMDFPVAVLKIHSAIYDALEGVRNRKSGYGVNAGSLAAIRKISVYLKKI